MKECIKAEILEADSNVNVKEIKLELQALSKQQGFGTFTVNKGGLDFLYFTQQADGRRGVFKVAGAFKGSYTTLEII